MSMSHKAYAFEDQRFQAECAALLTAALRSNDPALLRPFIEANWSHLKDPYEGGPLTREWWAEAVDENDVHQVAEVGLTLFFDPGDDRGLCGEWIDIDALLDGQPAQAALLGEPFGPTENYYNPGRQGSYFQSPEMVRASRALLSAHDPIAAASWPHFLSLLDDSLRSGRGLYITF